MFPAHTVPEIQRSALEQVVLNAKAAGVDDIRRFVWIQPPPKAELARAPAALTAMGALDAEGDLTTTGAELQTLATKIPIARLLVAADRQALGLEMATLAALAPLRVQGDLLRWDKSWDFATRHAVTAIHRRLAAACRDDLDFWFKLYSLWAEASGAERQEDLCRLFFIHRENLENKVAPARRQMLELLGTGKKSQEDRPLRLSALNRLRMILAATLTDDAIYQTGEDGSIRRAGSDAAALPLEIDEASVCAAAPPHFIALAKRIVSDREGRQQVLLSGLVVIESEWVELRKVAPLELAGKMAAGAPAGDPALGGGCRARLMLDIAYLRGGCYRLGCEADGRKRIGELVQMPAHLIPVTAADRFADASHGEIEGAPDTDPMAGWETPPRRPIDVAADEIAAMLPVSTPEETAPDPDDINWHVPETAAADRFAVQPLNAGLLQTREWKAAAEIEPHLEGLPEGPSIPWGCRVTGYRLSEPGPPVLIVAPMTEAQASIQGEAPTAGKRVIVEPLEVLEGAKEETALRVRLVETGEEFVVDAGELSFDKRYGLVKHYSRQPFEMAFCLRDGVARLTRLPLNEAALHVFFSKRPATVRCRLLERFGNRHHLVLEEPTLAGVVEGAFMSYNPHTAPGRKIFEVGQTYDLHLDGHYGYADEPLTVRPEGLDALIGQREHRDRIFWEPFRQKLHVKQPMDSGLLERLLVLSADRDYQTSVFRLYRHSNRIRVQPPGFRFRPLEFGPRASQEAFRSAVRPDYQPGERLRGRVSAIFPQRVMVVLERGGTGSIDIKHLAWITPADPREVVYPDQRLEVMFIGARIDPEKQGKEYLDLSLLDPAAFPNNRYARGMVLEVTIRALRGNHALAELEPGLLGRLPDCNIRHSVVAKIANYIKQDERLLARIDRLKKVPLNADHPIDIILSTKDVYQETIRVNRKRIGAIIGHRGATIRRLNELADCRLWVDMEKSTVAVSSWREEQIRVAEVLIRKVEAENWQPEGGQEHRQAQPAALRPVPARMQVQATVMIPEKKIGLLIGKKHATIKQLQEKSGCRIQYGQDGSVRITGSSEQNTARAMELIRILIPEASNKVG